MHHVPQRVYDKTNIGGAKMTDYVEEYGLKISDVLYSFVKDRALDSTGLAGRLLERSVRSITDFTG